jgi:hypothetical protein
VTFQNAAAVDTRATFSFAGTYVLRLSASDSALSNSDTVQVTVQPAPPPGGVTFERRVVAGSDDAEEAATGGMSLTSSDLELVYDGSNQKVGMRFTSVAVPRGATITRAYLQFEADEAQSELTNLAIQGQAADNAAVFGTASGNISTRARTVASVAWSPPAWGLVSEAGPNQRTPELATVVQEIINRTGWASGNALALIITGSGHRTARAYEGKPTGTPLLHIEYDNGPPQPPTNATAPTISGIARAGQALHAGPGTWNGTPPISYAYQWLRCDATGAGCGDISRAGGTSYTPASSDVGQTIRVTVTASNSIGSSAATSAQTAVVEAASLSDPVIAAAGDLCSSSIGDCAGTADLLDQINPTAVLTLGDNAYEDGSLAQYNAEYKPYWGRQDSKVYPAPGNHEFQTPNAQGYRDYFGARAPGLWYSYDLGTWHIISLAGDEGIAAGAGSAQEQFLQADLAAHPSQCTLAYWHEPRFSSGVEHGSDSGVSAFWNDLYAAGADLVLNGHEHNYERFAPQTPAGVASPTGIQQIIVGTGGANEGTYPFGVPIANSAVRNQGTPGVLKITLHPGSYDWQFVPAAGFSFTDSGSGTCH